MNEFDELDELFRLADAVIEEIEKIDFDELEDVV
ncbi:hypothetical protein Asulf_01496 [Archaeoglobus sulfaticallidus PM70-1]|uniref:Uncharacterized protein n=1 Tax=Archaeoglobus sulfaticallidus PM70-1 TaxID=387631 RepID=N0BCZ3_9EURY|nr:hypothetical protein Asulf_01496 [Archaeoglobus sulfaticallidus PM70-1]